MRTWVGQSVVRSDAESKVRGEAVYGVDFSFPGTLYAALVLSPVPAGRVVRIDASAALRRQSVVAVVTSEDAPRIRSGLALEDQPLFASERVHYVGEPVAAVVAETLTEARRAAREVLVEIDEATPVLSISDALDETMPVVHDDWESFEPAPGLPEWPRYRNVCGEMRIDSGDVDEAMRQAHYVVEDVFVADRQYQAYLEPKSASAVYEGGRFTIHVSHQFPWNVRSRTARALGVDPSTIRVVGHHIGGGFGARLDVSLEPYAALLARHVGAPVKLVFDRTEDLITCNSREGAVVRIRSGVTSDGRILARELLCELDAGAYATDTVFLISIPAFLAGSIYEVGAVRIRSRAVYTNTTPTGAFRGVSGTYLNFALERHTDNLARAVGMDRREFRLRNLMRDGHEMLNGQILHDAGILREAFEEADRVAPWSGLGKGPYRGVGIAATHWLTNPSAGQVTLKLDLGGTLGVVTGATENGSGAVAMGVRQIAADELGIDPEQVVLSMPDTDAQGFDGGSQGSRTTHIVGRAVMEAGAQLRAQVLERAAQLLGVSVEDVEFQKGEVAIRNLPERRVTLDEVAAFAIAESGPLVAVGTYATPPPKYDPDSALGLLFPTFPTPTYHVHIAEVEVDPSTGSVRVLRYVVVQEVGKVVNPAGVIGQIQGGVAQGIGYALYEGLEIDREGRYKQQTLESYRLPIAPDVPKVEVVLLEHPDEAGPHGAKGVAEPPIVPVAAAIGNAVADATGGRIDRIPITPERVLAALEERASHPGGG